MRSKLTTRSKALSIQPICHALAVSDCQALKKSCSIEKVKWCMKQISVEERLFNTRLSGIKPMNVNAMSLIPTGGTSFFAETFESPQCQVCTKMPEMSDLCYLGKTRM